MKSLNRADLMSLEEYAEKRPEFRHQVLEHKKNRKVPLGSDTTLYFEDRLTIQYQIQEMLRIEKTFEPAGIMEELEAYNPLIPDGSNWKATYMLEYPDPTIRQKKTAELIGIEDKVWAQVSDHDKVFAIADEDLDRANEEKTSAVHFLRFELTNDMINDLKQGAPLSFGVSHDLYQIETRVEDATVKSLIADFD